MMIYQPNLDYLTCPECGGRGWLYDYTEWCRNCGGDGEL